MFLMQLKVFTVLFLQNRIGSYNNKCAGLFAVRVASCIEYKTGNHSLIATAVVEQRFK